VKARLCNRRSGFRRAGGEKLETGMVCWTRRTSRVQDRGPFLRWPPRSRMSDRCAVVSLAEPITRSGEKEANRRGRASRLTGDWSDQGRSSVSEARSGNDRPPGPQIRRTGGRLNRTLCNSLGETLGSGSPPGHSRRSRTCCTCTASVDTYRYWSCPDKRMT
jgi:hypothetical protein